ncbi:MAG TPA: hypothetical protein VFO18_10290, partial [Methylomirabilota bacterium]|nr:hypothetical protein [Methylomirabilota bacterium]
MGEDSEGWGLRGRGSVASLVLLGLTALVILSAGAHATVAAESPAWITYTDKACGIEFKYPSTYRLNPSGAKDFCAFSANLGLGEGRQTRWLLGLTMSDMSPSHREVMLQSGSPVSASSFALYVAALHCQADGPDGSTYCIDGKIRSTFRTAQGLQGYEISLTEVHESVDPKKIEKQPKGPIFALDLSNGETIWLLFAEAAPGHLETLRAILNSVRVWSKPRRAEPRQVEIGRQFSLTGQAFNIRVTPKQPAEMRA